MRVCQPAPLALQRDRISAERRRLIATFGSSDGGRPTRLPPRLSTERESISAVSSGSSRSALFEVRRVAADFSGIALSHRENVACDSTGRVTNHDHAAIEKADTKHSSLSIVLPIIIDFQGEAGKDFTCRFEVEPALNKSPFSFCRVVGDSHVIIVYTISAALQQLLSDRHCGSLEAQRRVKPLPAGSSRNN